MSVSLPGKSFASQVKQVFAVVVPAAAAWELVVTFSSIDKKVVPKQNLKVGMVRPWVVAGQQLKDRTIARDSPVPFTTPGVEVVVGKLASSFGVAAFGQGRLEPFVDIREMGQQEHPLLPSAYRSLAGS